MLPAQSKLHTPQQFQRVIKNGTRAGSRTLVVYYYLNNTEVASTGPRFGLVISKAIGNAVIRHQTSRRLRHICLTLSLPTNADIVIRALPAAGTATSATLARDLNKALKKALSSKASA